MSTHTTFGGPPDVPWNPNPDRVKREAESADARELLLAFREAVEERRAQLAEPWLADPPLTHKGLIRIVGSALARLEEAQPDSASGLVGSGDE